MSKLTFRKKFHRRFDQPDRWPEVMKDLQDPSQFLGYDLNLQVEDDNGHEVSFLVTLNECDYQEFCSKFDWYLTSHKLRL